MRNQTVICGWLVACNGSPAADDKDTGAADTDTDTDSDSDADTDTDTDADSDADTDTDTGPRTLPDGPGVGGVLLDGDGNPLAGEDILACTDAVCLVVPTENDGWFWVNSEPDETYALKTHEHLDRSPRLGAGLVPAVVDGDSAVDVGVVFQPTLPAGQPWGDVSADPQTFDAGDGLALTLSRADVTLAILEDFGDVAAAQIPAERLPDYDLAEEVIAVYAIHPFAAATVTPMAISAPSTLAAGTEVSFRSISILGGHFSTPAVGHADGTWVTTDPGQGLTEITYVVISVP